MMRKILDLDFFSEQGWWEPVKIVQDESPRSD